MTKKPHPQIHTKCLVESLMANALRGQNLQFERHGYFVAVRVDHVQGNKPVLNLAVGLMDSWGK